MFLKRHVEGLLWTATLGLPLLAALSPSSSQLALSSRLWLYVLAVLWLTGLAIVIPLHFYRAWKRWPSVPNRQSYAMWVGFETLATLVLMALAVYLTLR
jgi:hypothetical protein